MYIREQRAVEINASVARALIHLEGMKAENAQRACRGESMAYLEKDFESIIGEEQIGFNDIIRKLSE